MGGVPDPSHRAPAHEKSLIAQGSSAAIGLSPLMGETIPRTPEGRPDVEARTGLVIGGMTAVAASVAVVTVVAFANTAALADSAGTSLASTHVTVPAAAAPTATPRATATPQPVPSVEPEVVAAPAPVVVAPPDSSAERSPAVSAPPAQVESPQTPAVPAAPDDFGSAIAAAKAAGTWDALRRWAAANGWSGERLEALIDRLERERSDDSGDHDGNAGSSWREKQSSQRSHGSQRPAHAGSNVGSGNGAGDDWKKDQSRSSPDERD